MTTVAVLFARRDSIYKTMPGCDVWDEDRDAMKWGGGSPVVAHPPCRLWGELSHMSTASDADKRLAPWAIDQVRRWGGALEHPARSKLWRHCGIRTNGVVDEFGGRLEIIEQGWFGHPARKLTGVYIVGCRRDQVPTIPMRLGESAYIITQPGRRKDGTRRTCNLDYAAPPGFSSRQQFREHTPPTFAEWLVEVARRCRPSIS